MNAQHSITFFHSPHTRSSSTYTLLEELGAPFDLRVLNMKAGEQRQPAYLAINPLGKVPAILDGDTVVTEQVAIFIHLADRFPEVGLAPSLDDPRRGAYLRWLVYYAACFEPALMDRSMERAPAPHMSSPYGDFDAMLGVIDAQLQRAPWLLGDTMSAADVLWGSALGWGIAYAGVPRLPALVEYAERCAARPASLKVAQRDLALMAEHEAAAA
ncbi:glutathione S-transferase family protein [Massilia sp. G4R7]|uniref:Glutathione S-transferase family protein n=1 Tax=Massilia phyllostachyos TaxID=2898585 RepID=A0ABS8Q6K3_9BURK|nr:glutathione S-transferase family protein [Massilia phyllostachyos]MCD2517224.1 glutathione S-transferase family protein [Massilia phyllostachyos]